MISSIIKNYKEKFPDPVEGIDYAMYNNLLPNRSAGKMLLKVVYGLSDEDAEDLLPTRIVGKADYSSSLEKEYQTLREEPVAETVEKGEKSPAGSIAEHVKEVLAK
jgi:hypothetical protein